MCQVSLPPGWAWAGCFVFPYAHPLPSWILHGLCVQDPTLVITHPSLSLHWGPLVPACRAPGLCLLHSRWGF